MTDTVSYLSKATTHEEKEHRAKTQYLLCLNCSAEIKAGEVEAKVINSKSYPVVVEFYEREITVVKKKIEARVNYSNNAIEAEITRDEPKGARVVGTPKRIDCGTETDMP